MDRKTLIMLAVAVVVLMVIIMLPAMIPRALSSETIALVDTEVQNFERARSTFSGAKSRIENAMLSAPALFASAQFREGWPQRLAAAQKRLDDAQEDLDQAKFLREENKGESEGKIDGLLTRVREARAFAVNDVTEMSQVAEFRLDFKRGRGEKVRELERAHQAVAGTNLSAIQSRVEQAIVDWPGKRQDLNSRLAVTQMVERANDSWQTVQEENAKQESPTAGLDESGLYLDYDRMIDAAASLIAYQRTVPATVQQIGNLVDQLYRSWDRILIDLNIREGLDVTFHQKLKIIEWVIKDVAAKEHEHTEREEWRQVSESEYKAMEKNLGMTVEHKSAGKYDHEVVRVAQPAGYAYIAPRSQGRNQYGEWRSGSGGSFWVFYGQYALMRTLFWGPRYDRPIYANDYDRYSRHHRYGRTYYGTDATGRMRYGAGGSFTSSRYASSNYNRSGGFKSSRYVQSGGTYRGSRYETRTSRSSASRFGRGK
jgi:hypothetical protein